MANRLIFTDVFEPETGFRAGLYVALLWIVLIPSAIGFVLALFMAPLITIVAAVTVALVIAGLVKLESVTARERERDAQDLLRQGSYSE